MDEYVVGPRLQINTSQEAALPAEMLEALEACDAFLEWAMERAEESSSYAELMAISRQAGERVTAFAELRKLARRAAGVLYRGDVP